MYSDLIIGFDGSAPSRDALALGRRLAEATGARPMVVCVHPVTVLTPSIPAEASADLHLREAAEQTLEAAREELSGVPGATFRAVAGDSTARALHEVAEQVDAPLLVLGSTHRTGLGRVIPGTTADQVLHAAPCAVAIAPAGYADAQRGPLGVVAAGVNGDVDTERVARVAARIAHGAGATLRIILVVSGRDSVGAFGATPVGYRTLADASREFTNATLDRAAAAAGEVPVERRTPEGHIADQLVAESEDADLLVLGSRGFGPLNRVLLGSVATKVVRAARCPVLIIPRRTAELLDERVAPLAEAAVR